MICYLFDRLYFYYFFDSYNIKDLITIADIILKNKLSNTIKVVQLDNKVSLYLTK